MLTYACILFAYTHGTKMPVHTAVADHICSCWSHGYLCLPCGVRWLAMWTYPHSYLHTWPAYTLSMCTILVMGDSPEKKMIWSTGVKFNSIRYTQSAHIFVIWTKSSFVKPKTLIIHESRCSTSWQEEVWEQWDSAKWEEIRNRNSKCCYSSVI